VLRERFVEAGLPSAKGDELAIELL